jgi:hypothetical protein
MEGIMGNGRDDEKEKRRADMGMEEKKNVILFH